MGFRFVGMYRVQSRRREIFSQIEGRWYQSVDKILDSAQVNAELEKHPHWKGVNKVNLQVADVFKRSGMFADEPDILYKGEFFSPKTGSPAFPSDIVDVNKSVDYWNKRLSYNATLFEPETFIAMNSLLGDLKIIIANEYFCHEAGHLLGYDVLSKYRDGYFRIGGQTLWSLIFVEEFRADLHSFGFALKLLPPASAVQIFLYNLMLRFGLAAYSVENQTDGYGDIPFLLFYLLYKKGFIELSQSEGVQKLRIAELSQGSIIEMMKFCDEHAESQLSEIEKSNVEDIALNAARYYSQRKSDHEIFSTYKKIMTNLELKNAGSSDE